MKKATLRIFIVLAAIIMVAAAMAVTTGAAVPEGTALSETCTISENGNYYLNSNVTGNITVASGVTATLDLNGYVLKADTSDGQSHRVITNNGTLTVKDSKNEDAEAHYFKVSSDGLWELQSDTSGETFTFSADTGLCKLGEETVYDGIPDAGSIIKVTGGCITGGVVNSVGNNDGGGIYSAGTLTLEGGNIVGNKAVAATGDSVDGGGIYIGGQAEMTGGAVIGNIVNGDTQIESDNFGGGIYVSSGVEFKLSGGYISYNSVSGGGDNCKGYGGGIDNYGKVTMSGGSITENTAEKSGGGIYNNSTGTLDISGNALIGKNEAPYGGGIRNFGKVTMSGGSITENVATESGGGIYSGGSGTLDISGTALIGKNQAPFGGGIDNYSKFTMSGGSITENAATKSGGGIYNNSSGTLDISGNALISINQATYGGGIYNCNSGTLDISGNALISKNQATYSSGIRNFGKVTMSGGSITENVAAKSGGGIHNGGTGTLDISGNALIGKNEAKWGGGIYNCSEVTMSGGSITENTATTSGGGIDNESTGTLNISGTALIGKNQAPYSGGIDNYGKVTMSGGSITENAATKSGGGIYNENTGTLDISGNALISINQATYGGGIYNESTGTLVISGNALISKNQATYSSGIRNFGKVTMSGGSITENVAAKSGGGIHNGGTGTLDISGNALIGKNEAKWGSGIYNCSEVTMSGGSITENVATTSGGGIYSDSTGTLNISGNALISKNQAPYGSGIYNDNKVTMSGGSITENTATERGGGIYNSSTGTLNVSGNALISKNQATFGGGFYNDNEVTMSGGSITENTATNSGGIYNSSTGTLNISENALISKNQAPYGSGIYNDNKVTMSGGSITENTATERGGGIYNSSTGTLDVSGTALIGKNQATFGGGFFNDNEVTMSGGGVTENAATNSGGGIYNSSTGTLDISGTALISKNQAPYGSGIYNDNKVTMSGGSITENTATERGGGIYNSSTGTLDISGTALIGKNQAKYGGGICNNNGNLNISGAVHISENEATWGGGINSSGTIIIKGAEITGNKITGTGTWKSDFGAAGIDFCNGSITVSGTVIIKGNLTNGEKDNLFMEFDDNNSNYGNNTPIVIGEDGLDAGSEIGITHYMTPSDDSPIAVTAQSALNTDTIKTYFTSDDMAHVVTLHNGATADGNYLELANFTLSAVQSDTATVTLENDAMTEAQAIAIANAQKVNTTLTKETVIAFAKASDFATSNKYETITASSTSDWAAGTSMSPAAMTADMANKDYFVIGTVAAHSHSWTYALSTTTTESDTITATCSGAGTCPSTDTGITIVKPEHTEYGDGKSASATIKDGKTDLGEYKVSADSINYEGTGSTSYTKTTTAPTVAGTYKASITVGDKTAYVEYTIDKADSAITTTPTASTGLSYTGSAQELIANTPAVTGGTVHYAISTNSTTAPTTGWSTTKPTGTNAGDYYVWYKVTGDSNHKDITAACLASPITIAKAILTITEATVSDKTYDGTTTAAVTEVTFSGLQNGESLTPDTDYTVSGVFDSADATGTNAATKVTVTVTLKDTALANNYKISGTKDVDKTIGKAVTEDRNITVYTKWTDNSASEQDNTCSAYKFTDLDLTQWYYDGINFCVENGYMQGVSSDQFAPNSTLSRAMIVTILWRMEGSPVADYAMSFKDVPADEWYTEAIRWAQSTKVVEGYNDETFGQMNDVTREQLAAILYRYAAYKGYDVTNTVDLSNFVDANAISSWATDSVKWANAVGIINGRTDTIIAPDSNATRAEAACMVQRFCENIAK